jgi:ketosteroid isomerase-like protein
LNSAPALAQEKEEQMAVELPAPIAGYFSADKAGDPYTAARHFTEDAVVRDEGHTYAGREAIRKWKNSSSAKYTYAVEPFAISEDAGLTTVSAHLTGNFPGSPVDLRYCFALEGEQIAGLEIVA